MMANLSDIRRNAERLLREIPDCVTLLAAAKTRSVEEVSAAYEAGIRFFGHNYVQEARAMIEKIEFKAHWHMIGHLQRNKAKDAVNMFDMIESLDSIRLANELEKRCAEAGKTLNVLIEINSGAEEDKSGILPDELDSLVEVINGLNHLRLKGLMTMGLLTGDPESSRPCFIKTRKLFERLREFDLPNKDIQMLSMGMSGSYRVAIEEGATMVRIGTLLFGPRA